MAKQRSKRSAAAQARLVEIDSVVPNDWNPNVQSDAKFQKERESIREFGFVDPITTRSGRLKGPLFPKPEIIDGEHRWKGAKAEGLTHVLVVDLGRMSDARAKVLTDVLNNLRGRNDQSRWLEMIESIREEDATQILFLPYGEEELAAMMHSSAIDWSQFEAEGGAQPASVGKDGRLYKKFSVALPEATYEQLLDLLRKLKAARKLDSEAAAFEVLVELAAVGMRSRTKRPNGSVVAAG